MPPARTAIEKYLSRHAEPEAAAAAALSDSFGHAIQIPAYGETDALFAALGSVPEGPRGQVLVVLVLNARADSPPAVHAANEAAKERLRATLGDPAAISADPPISLYSLERGKLLLVDRALPGHTLPEGQGVGLARKIGSDLIVRLHAEGRIASPWIHCTDADAILPRDYFEQVRKLDPAGTGAAVYFFEHQFAEDPALGRAGRLYEISLRYLVLGLAWSGSPYAYQNMGSCLAIPVQKYVEVRGFPRRSALEDFYALNKLAKVGRVVRLSGSPILLAGRTSERVPISTGRAISRIASGGRGSHELRLLHPLVFAHLAAWLEVLASVARSRGDLRRAFAKLAERTPFFRGDLLEEAVERMGAATAIRQAVDRSSSPETLLRHLHTWFDAFRTIRLLHFLRDGGFPSPGWREALSEAPFAAVGHSTDEDPELLRRRLARPERRLPPETGVPSLELDRA